MFGMLLAGATGFHTKYTPSQAVHEIAANWRDAIWPGEFGYYLVPGIFIQAAPLWAAVLWLFCLAPWRKRWARMLSLAAALLVPGWIVLFAPITVFVMGVKGVEVLFKGGYGEDYEENGPLVTAIVLWWILLLPLLLMTLFRRAPNSNVCPKCGYAREGLPAAAVCPECGKSADSESGK
jgi:rubredoxin